MNLLIVDDDPTSLKLLRTQLESEGHAVLEAHDGVDALALLERQRVDAVISDVLMPRLDGYRLCHEIRKHTQLYDLPVIIYTSTYTAPGDEKLALDVGADKYLKKPLSIETIIAALHEVTAVPHAARHPKALQEVELPKEYSEQLVSKLKEKNVELMAAEVKFRTLVEQSIVGIYIIQDDQFAYVNPTMAEIYGRSVEEMTSRSLYDFAVPEDHALLRENIRRRISGAVSSVQYDLRVLHQSGAVLQVAVHGSRTEYNGRPAVMGMLVDITERKRAEESLRLQSAALHAAADVIVITDRADVIEWVNPAFTQLTGYTAEEAIGKTHRDLVRSGTHAPAFYKELWETILAGRSWHGEMINRREDGSLYTEDQSVTPILDASGAITHFVAIGKDITARLQLEAQFLQAQKMESVGRLAGGVAHDFNNLLSVILGWTGMALEDLPAEHPIRPSLEEVLSAGQRATGLTRQLLAFSRQQVVEPTLFDINTLVVEADKMLRRLIGEDIELVTRTDPKLGAVKMDRGQLEQVLMNLVVNARDAMPKGGTLVIETTNVVLDAEYPRVYADVMPGDYVMLAVSDSGTGMSEEVKAHLFEPFFTTKEQGKGTGLGLATSYGIVTQAGGDIAVHSAEGRGTTMRVYLPRHGEAGEAVRDRKRTSVHGVETILLVEDDPAVRRVTARMLETLGYRVVSTASGEEALRVIENSREPLHLLLTDVVLAGGMSGPELAERVRAVRPEQKVLFVSGYTRDVTILHGLLEQRITLVQKPFTAESLGEKVRQALDAK